MLKMETQVLLCAIKQAGDEIKRLQSNEFTISYKHGQHLLTSADLLANQILKDELLSCFGNDGWLSEESDDDLKRLEFKRVWVVDPIDGTKEFVQGLPEYAVSVALIEDGVPIMASVYNPAKDQLFHAIKDQGAWLNDRPIYCDRDFEKRLTVLASRTEIAKGAWKYFAKINEVKPMGSIAYKLALVASGYAHATFSLDPKSEWDIAAGILLVQEAGGRVTDTHQNVIKFNQRNTRVNSIVASTQETFSIIHKQIKGNFLHG